METRTPTFRMLLLPIGFSLVCAVLTLMVFKSFGGVLPLQPKGYRVSVTLPQASNLVTGSDVQIAGVDVGKVTAVKRTGNAAAATLELKPEFAPLRTGARVIARTKTLLGEGYVELTAGPRTAPAIPEGGRLAARQTTANVQLDEFLQTFGPRTRRDLRSMFIGLASAFAGRGEELNDVLGSSAPASTGIDQVLTTLDRQRPDLSRMISGSAGVLGALGERDGELQSAITAGDDVLAITARRSRGLRATVRSLPPFLRQLRVTSSTIQAASPDLDQAARALRPVAARLAPALRQTGAASSEVRALFRALPATIEAGRRGLPALSRTIGAARPALTALYPALRELIPVVQLIAANPDIPAGPFANVASVTAGIAVGPGGLVQHYASGLPTVWNETVGGWAKRLGSNRLNPYVKPGGLNDIAAKGYIKSFDCRNEHNANPVPPTGGVMPCVLQGPWTFNGKSAFYPRLTLAPR